MQLPRRLPQGQVPSAPSPALVAGGSSAALVAGVAQAAQGVYQDYRETKQKAEYASAFHGAMSETQAALDEWNRQIAATGRYMQNEAGEQVPTHTLVVQSYDTLASQLRDRTSRYTGRLSEGYRVELERQVEASLQEKRGDVVKLERALFLEDMRATFDDNLQMYLGAGNFDGAAQMIKDYFDGGIFTAEERAKQLSDLRNRYAVTTSQDLIAGAQSQTDYMRAMDYVQSPEISSQMTPAQRDTLLERALSRAESVDAEADDRLTKRQGERAAELESLMLGQLGANALTWEEIAREEQTGGISPQQALGLRKTKRSLTNTGADDQETVRYLESLMFRLSESGTNFDGKREELYGELIRMSDRLSGPTFGRFLGEIRTLDGQRFTNPMYRQAEEYLKNAIMSVPSGFTIFADEATARKTDAYNAAAAAMFRAAQEAGPEFDALSWAESNLDRFKTQARPAQRSDPPASSVFDAQGKVDVAATRAAWQQLLQENQISLIEFNDRVRQLAEYQNATAGQ